MKSKVSLFVYSKKHQLNTQFMPFRWGLNKGKALYGNCKNERMRPAHHHRQYCEECRKRFNK